MVWNKSTFSRISTHCNIKMYDVTKKREIVTHEGNRLLRVHYETMKSLKKWNTDLRVVKVDTITLGNFLTASTRMHPYLIWF